MEIKPVVTIEPSATVAVNSLAIKKKKAGERVYNLSAGEPMIDTDPAVVDAAKAAMQEGKTHYVPVAGISELREAAARWMNSSYSTDYNAENCLVTCGGKFGVNAVVQSLVAPGEEVIILAPYWVSYPSIVTLYGGVPVILSTTEEKKWKITAEEIQSACNDNTKMLILNNASNPTGVLYPKRELEEILQVAKDNNLIVLSDEVYSGLVYDGADYTSAANSTEFGDNVIVVQSLSKNFAMTGWRVGFVFGDEGIIKALTSLQGQSTTGTATISQWAALKALENADRISKEINVEMHNRRDAFVEEFNKLFPNQITAPTSGLYCFIAIKDFGVDETDSVAFCTRVLSEANVAMVPGAAFGKEGYVRCSFGSEPEELREVLQVLVKYVK
jgi:aspartate aminotransferase